MNSKQGARYIKRRMGNDLKQKILSYNGIDTIQASLKIPSLRNCPRCELINAIENKFCSKCSYPLIPSAYEQIKESEEKRIAYLEEQIRFHFSSSY